MLLRRDVPAVDGDVRARGDALPRRVGDDAVDRDAALGDERLDPAPRAEPAGREVAVEAWGLGGQRLPPFCGDGVQPLAQLVAVDLVLEVEAGRPPMPSSRPKMRSNTEVVR